MFNKEKTKRIQSFQHRIDYCHETDVEPLSDNELKEYISELQNALHVVMGLTGFGLAEAGLIVNIRSLIAIARNRGLDD